MLNHHFNAELERRAEESVKADAAAVRFKENDSQQVVPEMTVAGGTDIRHTALRADLVVTEHLTVIIG